MFLAQWGTFSKIISNHLSSVPHAKTALFEEGCFAGSILLSKCLTLRLEVNAGLCELCEH